MGNTNKVRHQILNVADSPTSENWGSGGLPIRLHNFMTWNRKEGVERGARDHSAVREKYD